MSQFDSNVRHSAESARQLILGNRLLVIAHRGNSRVEPENTLPAFRSALGLGVDLVELDYQQAADGTAVVIHDVDLNRTTDARERLGSDVRVADMNWAELAALDAGSWFRPNAQEVRLSTLGEAVSTIAPRALPLIERKSGDAARCVDVLRRASALNLAVVQAFDWQFLSDCHALAPELALAVLGEHELTPARLGDVAKTGASVVCWDARTTGAQQIVDIHDRGYKAWVWTVDDPDRMLQLAAAGIDAIITNQPALAMRTLSDNPRRKIAC